LFCLEQRQRTGQSTGIQLLINIHIRDYNGNCPTLEPL
jgi:hypothetical protein